MRLASRLLLLTALTILFPAIAEDPPFKIDPGEHVPGVQKNCRNAHGCVREIPKKKKKCKDCISILKVGSSVDTYIGGFMHAIEIEKTAGGNDCSDCGTNTPAADLDEYEFLAHVSPRKPGVTGTDLGIGAESSLNVRVSFFEDANGGLICDVNSPFLAHQVRMEDGRNGDPLDGVFNDLLGGAIDGVRLLDQNQTLTTDLSLAATAVLTNRDGSSFEFEVVDLNGDKIGRVTHILDRRGYGTTITYKSFTPVEIAADPAIQRQVDSLVDAIGRTYTFTYKTYSLAGGSVLDTVTLPGGGIVTFDYDQSQSTLSSVTRPDGFATTLSYTVDGNNMTVLELSGHEGKTQKVFMDSNFAVGSGTTGGDFYQEHTGLQIYNQSSLVTQTVELGDEVRYAIFGSQVAPYNHRVIYNGAGRVFFEEVGREWRFYKKDVDPVGTPITFASFVNEPLEDTWEQMIGRSTGFGFHGDRVVSGTPDLVTDASGVQYDLNYTPDNTLAEKIYPDGTYETWERNEFQQPTRHRDRLGRVTRNIYDAQGNALTREVGLVDAQYGANSATALQTTALPNVIQSIGGTATQSSEYPIVPSPASNAVDGNTDGKFLAGSTSGTGSESTPWWEFTFDERVWMGRISLWNRSDACCNSLLKDFRITIFDGATEVFAVDYPNPVGRHTVIGGIEKLGDRIRISFNDNGNSRSLRFAELAVFGTTEANAGNGYSNIALHPDAIAAQSSENPNYPGAAAKAIDGSDGGSYGDGGNSNTASEPGAWWELTLADRSRIDEIAVFNRTDSCCLNRLRYFQISVFDGPNKVYSRYFDDPAPRITSLYNFPHLVGDRIRIEHLDLENSRTLHLAEVKVYGVSVGGTSNGVRDEQTADYALYETQYYPAGHQNQFLKQYEFDALGNRTEFIYNADQQLTDVIEPDDTGAGYHTAATLTYDAANRLHTSTDAAGRITTFEYDSRERLYKTTYHDTSTELIIFGTGVQADLVVKQKDRNGNVTKFDYDNAGRRDQIITAYSTMDADGSNEVVNPASLQSVEDCTFQAGTDLKVTCDRDGDLVTYEYDYRHRLESSTRYPRDGVSLTDSREYVNNLLFSTTDAYGRNTYYAYRDSDSATIRTVKGTVPSFTLVDFVAVEALTRDLTVNADYLITDYVLDSEGQRLATIDPRGVQHETDYDSRGRSITRREAVGTIVEAETNTQYDANSNVRFQTNARGYITEQTYTRRNLLESRTVALGTADQATESFTYFDDRRPDQHVDFRGNTSYRVWHNCCGRLQATIDQLGHGSISNNDYYGNVTHTATVKNVAAHAGTYHDPIDTGSNGTLAEVTTRFDGRHRPIARTVWLTPLGYVDPNAVPIFEGGLPSDPTGSNGTLAGLTTTYEYFDHALTTEPKLTALLAELTADGIDLDYVNNDGAAVLTTNPEGEISVSIMDGAGRSIASAMLDPVTYAVETWATTTHDAVVATGSNGTLLETTSTDALGHQNSSYSDGAGRTLETIDADGNVSRRDYDANGNVESTRDPNGVGQDCIFDERNRDVYCLDTFGDATSRIYDVNNNVVASIDAKLNVTTTLYDARDRRESVTDRLDGTTVYTYDDNSNLKTITDAETKVTIYTYDVRNLKTHTQYPDHLPGSVAGDADYGIEECSFDAMRRKEVCTDQLGDTVTCEYDMASRKEFRKYRLNGAAVDESVDAFTYDGASRLLTADKGRYSNAIGFTYDEIGRRETESLTIDGQTYLASHVYDAANRITECTYPDGSVVTKAYTDRNQLETVHQAPDAVTAASLIGQFGYDLGMREISRLHGNGLITDTQYRDVGSNGTVVDNLKDSITVKDGLNNTIGDLSFTYGYDANKNVTSETTSGTVMAGNSYSATYDDQDRLKTWTRTNAVDAQSWNLDLVGNWDGFTNNGTAQVRTYSDAHETDTIDGNALSHDSKGNLSADTNGQTYTWDIDNHLESSIVGVSPASTYEYDALGRRVAKTVSGVKTVFFSLAQAPSYGFTPGQVIAEYAGGVAAATPLRTFVYGTYIDEPIAKIESGNTLYYHTNRKYDVAGLTDANGNIVELYSYSPYGSQTMYDASGTEILISAQNNPYGFTGRRLDEETGLWYFRARYFDSELGRFISRDPIGYTDGQNMYQYVGSRPFSFIDPAGLAATEITASATILLERIMDLLGMEMWREVIYRVSTSLTGYTNDNCSFSEEVSSLATADEVAPLTNVTFEKNDTSNYFKPVDKSICESCRVECSKLEVFARMKQGAFIGIGGGVDLGLIWAEATHKIELRICADGSTSSMVSTEVIKSTGFNNDDTVLSHEEDGVTSIWQPFPSDDHDGDIYGGGTVGGGTH